MSINKLFYSTKSEERLKAAKEPGLVEDLAGFDIINFIMQEPVPEVIYEVCKNNKVNIVDSKRLSFLRKNGYVVNAGMDRIKAFIEGSLKQPTEISGIWDFLNVQFRGRNSKFWDKRNNLPIATLLSTTAEYLKTLDSGTALYVSECEFISDTLMCIAMRYGLPEYIPEFTKTEGQDIITILDYVNSNELLDSDTRVSVLGVTSKVMSDTKLYLTEEGIALVNKYRYLLFPLVDKQLSIIQCVPEHASCELEDEVGNLHYMLANCITKHTNMDRLINANKVLDYHKNEMYDASLKGTVDVCAETKFVRIDRVGV